MRILPINRIPEDIWDGKRLGLPECLRDHYRAELTEKGILEQALGDPGRLGHGGKSEEDTNNHFTRAFPSSSGRVIYAIHAPTEPFSEVSDTLLEVLSYGHVSILDIACGTGAMTSSLITALIHLRRTKIIPALPLNISVCGADYSEPSLSVFNQFVARLVPDALQVGIRLNWSTVEWDATVGYDTARLIKEWNTLSEGATDHLIFVNNFSDALKHEAAFDAFHPNFHTILSSLYDKQGAVVWLEPISTNKRVKLIDRLSTFFGRLVWWKGAELDESVSEERKASYQLRHPFETREFGSDVHVHYFSRYSPDTK